MPSMTVQTAAMRRLRRDLEASRMRAALAPAGGVAKKPSPPPPRPARRADGGNVRLGRARTPSPSAGSCPRHAAAPVEPADTKNASMISFSKGAQVRVRTPVGALRTGQRLVLWLGAAIVSAAEEEHGYLRVVYNSYKHPRSDTCGTVRVAKKDVKNTPPAAAVIGTAASVGSSTVTTSLSARPAQGKATPRPTTAGKKLPLPKKVEKEMRSKSEAILASW